MGPITNLLRLQALIVSIIEKLIKAKPQMSQSYSEAITYIRASAGFFSEERSNFSVPKIRNFTALFI